jgi:hypothetical protein
MDLCELCRLLDQTRIYQPHSGLGYCCSRGHLDGLINTNPHKIDRMSTTTAAAWILEHTPAIARE